VKRSRQAPPRQRRSPEGVAVVSAFGGERDATPRVVTLRQPVEWRRNDPPDDGDDEGISNL
jgi:hypothetical protein